jgi:hypothetical protein
VIDDECIKKMISRTNKKRLSNLNNKGGNTLSIKGNYVRNSFRSSVDYNINDNSLFKKLNSFHTQKRLTKEFKEFELRNSPIRIKTKIGNNNKAFIGKRLNTISKNIQNANEVIHNPNEFYMNFFNNIIKNENDIVKEEPKKEKASTLISFNN